MLDKKTSLLINRQVPEFVREEHPKFIAFLEAYYEFLETKQGTQLNDLIKTSKDLRYLSDVDYSIDAFETQFFNTFASLISKDTAVTKEFLIKNILPFYLSKGSESSFKLLFRLLFGEEVTVSYPKDKILRSSDGKWLVENSLRISMIITTLHCGDGVTKQFRIASCKCSVTSDTTFNGKIYINGVEQTSGFIVIKELNKLIFDVAPSLNDEIIVAYNNFNQTQIQNRKITGQQSGATAIIERINTKNLFGQNYIELSINKKTLSGSFINAEKVNTDFIDNYHNTITVQFQTLSDLKTITVIDGGANYNVGDPVIVRGPATRSAIAVVSDVSSGAIEDVSVVFGGAGFQANNIVEAIDISNTAFDAIVQTVDATGTVSPNVVTFFTETIEPFSSVVLNVADYGFTFPSTNANTVLIEALANTTLNTLGPATAVLVNSSTLTTNPGFNIIPPTVNNAVRLDSLGIIGRIDINSGGTNYANGEYLIFTNQLGDYQGRGANAYISSVNSTTGEIVKIEILNGGLGYSKDYFPTITVNTANGSNANLSVNCLMGDGEILQGVLQNTNPGQIQSIKILDPGLEYVLTPEIDLTKSGNGQALANAQIQNSYVTFPGRWTTSDSIISSDDRRLQGRDYYVNYSYVLSSKIEFNKYKNIFKELVHPAGFNRFAEYHIEQEITSTSVSTESLAVEKTTSGYVNVNSSIYVTGTNTKFLAVSSLITSGNTIAINSEVRVINTVISNTEFTVTSPFTISSNNESLKIVS